MSKREKLFERLQKKPSDFRFEELRSVLESFGFVLRGERGSHATFVHDSLEEILTVKRKNPLKRVYLDKALEAIYQVKEASYDEPESPPKAQ